MQLLSDLPRLLFAAFVILVAGGVVFYALERDPLRYSRIERFAYCYPLGLAALGMPMFLMSWAGLKMPVLPVLVLIAASAAFAYLVRRVPPTRYIFGSTTGAQRPPLTEIEWVFVGIIVACLAARTLASLLTPLYDWDGICVWGLKAKVVFYDTIRDTNYFQRRELSYSNPMYPLLWPTMYAWVASVLGRWDDLGIFILNPLNLIALAILFYCATRRFAARTTALAVTAMLVSLPALIYYTECAQADVPLMLISAASFFCLFDWMQSRRLPSLLLAALLMGGAMFTKEEGKIIFVAHATAAALSIAVGRPSVERKKLFGHLLLYMLLAGVWILPWLLFQRTIPRWAWYFRPVTLSNLRWYEIPTFCFTIIRNALKLHNGVGLPKWNFLWPIVMVFLLVSKAPRSYPWNCALLVFVLHATGVTLVWLCSTDPLTLEANEFAWERFTLIMMPPLWLVFAKCVDEWWLVWKQPSSPKTYTPTPRPVSQLRH
jgi:hypothetical protein